MSKRSGKNLRIGVVGAQGRMGQEILSLAEREKGFVVGGTVGSGEWGDLDPKLIDIVIDFSTPKGLKRACAWCVQSKIPLVSGTTGLSTSDYKSIRAAAKAIPLLHAANMSLGVAALNSMLKSLRGLEDWDFQIDEIHHKLKKDSPSGTALMLDQTLSETLGRKLPRPNSIRGGGVPGIHHVWAMGPEEVLVLQHTAFNRQVFARGALRAARWLFDKGRPGLYDLTHLFDAQAL